MSQPSAALRALIDALPFDDDMPVTWRGLKAALEAAERWQSLGEYEDYMGEDL